jgi:carboxypeptidase C (cathepsin A)
VQDLLIKLLNEDNDEVRVAHDSIKNKKILAKQSFEQNQLSEKDTEMQNKQSFEQNQLSEKDTEMQNKEKKNLSLKKRTSRKQRKQSKNDLYDISSSDSENEMSSYEYEDVSFSKSNFESLYVDSNDLEDRDNDNNMTNIMLKSRTIKVLRQQFVKLFKNDQEQFDQKQFNFKQLLILNLTKIYTIENLKNEKFLDRALRLLYLARFERRDIQTRVNSHIIYDKLSITVVNVIQAKQNVKETQVKESMTLLEKFKL